jgi:uncharacterized protein (TIGR02145 family)
VERDNPFDENSIDYKPIWNSVSQYVFTDSRDGKQYKAIGYEYKIEIYEGFKPIWSVVWMGENLNYNASGSICYLNDPDNCNKYGRLYNWETAMTVCPSGWHLPSYEEWRELGAATFGKITGQDVGRLSEAGMYLRADRGWDAACNGNNDFFSALPGGYSEYRSFDGVGIEGRWWIGDAKREYFPYITTSCSNINVSYDILRGYYTSGGSDIFLSVRCVKNN